MKKIIRILLLVLVVGIIVIQFFQPEKNLGKMTTDHMFLQTKVPESVQLTLKKACLDCHSNQTHYQWYHKFAPVSWFISNHIHEGKHELNLSEWRPISTMDKIGKLEDMKKEVQEGKMPLKSYTLIHADARLSEVEKQSLIQWIESYQEDLVLEATE